MAKDKAKGKAKEESKEKAKSTPQFKFNNLRQAPKSIGRIILNQLGYLLTPWSINWQLACQQLYWAVFCPKDLYIHTKRQAHYLGYFYRTDPGVTILCSLLIAIRAGIEAWYYNDTKQSNETFFALLVLQNVFWEYIICGFWTGVVCVLLAKLDCVKGGECQDTRPLAQKINYMHAFDIHTNGMINVVLVSYFLPLVADLPYLQLTCNHASAGLYCFSLYRGYAVLPQVQKPEKYLAIFPFIVICTSLYAWWLDDISVPSPEPELQTVFI